MASSSSPAPPKIVRFDITLRSLRLTACVIAGAWARILLNLGTIVGGYMRGQLITSASIFVFTFGLLLVCKVPNALVLATFAGLTDVIPFVGGLLAARSDDRLPGIREPDPGAAHLRAVAAVVVGGSHPTARGYQLREGAWVKGSDRLELTLSEQSGQTKVLLRQTRQP